MKIPVSILIITFLASTSEIDPMLDMQNCRKILLYAQKNNDKISEAMALSQIGYDYRALGNNSKSLVYNLKATALAAETDNLKLKGNVDINLAHIYKDQADYLKAISFYQRTGSYGTAIKDPLIQLWAFSSLAQVYMEMNKLDSALIFAQRSYELSSRYDTTFLSTVYTHLGSIHGKLKNNALAVSYFSMAITEAKKINSIRWLNESFSSLAKYYYDVNQLDSSIFYAKKAVSVVKNTVFSTKSIKPAKLLLDIYENTNSDSAIKYFKLYRAANDSLFSTKNIQQTQLLTFENELQLQQLAAEKSIAQHERRQNIQYALMALGIIVLISLYLLLSRSFITNTNLIKFFGVIALLIVFEFLNLLLHPFLERVTHHSPILMLLALVAIAAMLVPLHHKLEHWATTKLVEKNKKIRLAAAKKTIEQLEEEIKSKNCIMKNLFTLLFFISITTISYAQDPFRQSADKTIDSLKRVVSTSTKPIDRFTTLVAITQVAFTAGDTDSATCMQLLQIAQNLNNDSLLAISYNIFGQYASRIKGDHATGFDYFFKAIPLAEKANDKRRLSSIYFDLALVYANLQNNEEFGKYTRKGGENLPDTSHPLYNFMLAQYQRNMADYFLQKHLPDSALVYAQPLTITSQRINSQLYMFNANFLNGAVHSQLGDKEMAALYFKKAHAQSASKSAFSRLRFASIYIPFLLSNKDFAGAKEQAMQLFSGYTADNNDFKLKGAGFMRQVYDSIGKPDSAYYYAKKEIELNRLIFNQNNLNKIQALAFNEQIRNIEEESRQRNEAQQRRHNLQYALIALGIIVLITLYFLLSRSFITNTNLIKFFGVIALLIVFEFLNLLLHPFLERVTHHSPILMLLALVAIAAMLVPLHHKLEHWATTKLVEKNKKIRLAAAKKTIEKLEGDND